MRAVKRENDVTVFREGIEISLAESVFSFDYKNKKYDTKAPIHEKQVVVAYKGITMACAKIKTRSK